MIRKLSISKADARAYYSEECFINDALDSRHIKSEDVINIEESIATITVWYRSGQ